MAASEVTWADRRPAHISSGGHGSDRVRLLRWRSAGFRVNAARLGLAAFGSLLLSACLPHEPLPYSPNYSRVTLADPATAPVNRGAVSDTTKHTSVRSDTMFVPDACITPDVAEQPLYLPPGCANNLNLQMMVERPGDLVQGRQPGRAAAAPAVRAAQRYLYGGTEAERRSGRLESSEGQVKALPPSLPQSTRSELR